MTEPKAVAAFASPIAEDVRQGLSAEPKRLPAKLFYDAEGSRLFDEITRTPEYYPTRTERAILQTNAAEIVRQAGENLDLVELGAGKGSNISILSAALCQRQFRAVYQTIRLSRC